MNNKDKNKIVYKQTFKNFLKIHAQRWNLSVAAETVLQMVTRTPHPASRTPHPSSTKLHLQHHHFGNRSNAVLRAY